MNNSKVLQKRKFQYKWVIAGMCFLMVFAGLGFCSSAKSLYIAAITDALGFSRSAFSINDSCRYITTAVANAFFGVLVARFGTKRLIGAGLVCLIISSLLYSFATNLSLFYLGGFFLGLGVAWTTTSMVGAVINKWFKKNKGTVLGAVLASNGLGAAIAIHITTPIIYQDGNPFGYQDAYRLVALILAVVTVIVMLFYRENPPTEDSSYNEEATAESKKKTEGWQGFDYQTILKKPYFYAIIVCTLLNMLVSVGSIVTPHLTDIGLTPTFVASALSIQVIALAIFKFGIGFIYDRFGLKASTNICLITGIISKLLLFFITNSATGKALTVTYSLLTALSAPLETVMLPIFVLDLFGEKSFNKTLGILTCVSTAGQALGAPVLNLAYDLCQSYNIAFFYSTLASVVITVIMNRAMVVSAREKKSLQML